MAFAVDYSFLRKRAVLLRIAVATLTCAAIGVAYGKFSTRWYRSSVTVVPASSQKGSLGGALGSLGSLASGLDTGATEIARIAAVLQGTAVTDAVIEKLNLRQRYGATSPEEARESVWGHCAVAVLSKPNLVQLSCEDKDPKFVQELLQYFAEYGNQTFRRVSVSSAAEEVRFLDKHVTALREQADVAAGRLREFQERHLLVDLDSQARAVVSSMAVLNAQRIAKQMELSYSRGYSSIDEASTRQIQAQLGVLDEQLRDLEMPPLPAKPESQSRTGGKNGGLFPAALAVPKLRAEMEALYRDRKVAEVTLMYGLERLTAARATEARESSTFQVLDPPTLPTRKSRPSGMESMQIGAALGFLLAFLLEAVRANRTGIIGALRAI